MDARVERPRLRRRCVVDENAPLHEIPVYLRDGATVPVVAPLEASACQE